MKPTRVSPALAWLLSLSLLLAAVWGQWHRVAHDTVPRVSVAAWADVASSDAASPDAAGHAAGSALCQMLDHLAHSDGTASAMALDLSTALPLATPAWQVGQAVHAYTQRLFEARAPPRFA